MGERERREREIEEEEEEEEEEEMVGGGRENYPNKSSYPLRGLNILVFLKAQPWCKASGYITI